MSPLTLVSANLNQANVIGPQPNETTLKQIVPMKSWEHSFAQQLQDTIYWFGHQAGFVGRWGTVLY